MQLSISRVAWTWFTHHWSKRMTTEELKKIANPVAIEYLSLALEPKQWELVAKVIEGAYVKGQTHGLADCMNLLEESCLTKS